MDNIPPEGTGRINRYSGAESSEKKPFTLKSGVHKGIKVTEAAARLSGSESGLLSKDRKLAERKTKSIPGQTILNPPENKDEASLAGRSVEELKDTANRLMKEIRDSQKRTMFSFAGERVESLLAALDNKDETDLVQGGLAGLKLPDDIQVEIIRNDLAVRIIPPDKSLNGCTVKELRFYCTLCSKVIHSESGNDKLSAEDHLKKIEDARAKLQAVHSQIVKKVGKSDLSGQLEKLDSEPCSHDFNLTKDQVEGLVPEKYQDIASECILKLTAYARKNTTASKPDPKSERRIHQQENERLNQQRKSKLSKGRPSLEPSTGKVTSAKPENFGESEKKRELEARVQALEAENRRLKNQVIGLESGDDDKAALTELNRVQQKQINELSNANRRLMEENHQLGSVSPNDEGRINTLKSSLEEQRSVNDQLREQNQRLMQTRESVSASNAELESKVRRLEQAYTVMGKAYNELSSTNTKLLDRAQRLNNDIQTLKLGAKASSRRIQQLQDENRMLSKTPSVDRPRASEGDLVRLKKELSQLKHENQQLNDENKSMAELKKAMDRTKQEMRSLEQNVARMNREKDDLQRRNDDLANRLTKMMSAKIMNNNPAIADLSDAKRPTKLAEFYNELYDNEWTDAYEILGGESNGKNAIEILRLVLLENKGLADDFINKRKDDLAKTEGYTDFRSVKDAVQEQKIMDALKKECHNEKTLGDSVEKVIGKNRELNKLSPDKKASQPIKTFAEQTARLCIWMAIQSPPVTFADASNPGDDFDTNRYRYYTDKGKRVDFHVWPAMLLSEEGGEILLKGVAQGEGGM